MKLVQTLIFTTCLSSAVCSLLKQPECVAYKPQQNSVSFFLKGDQKIDVFKLVKFLLFTNKNRYCTQELIINDRKSVVNSNFNPLIPTRVLIHGWKSNERSKMVHLIKEAYLTRGSYNIIATSWGSIAQNINYNAVRSYVPDVGLAVSKFLEFLNQISGLSYNNVYLIGHSLGAHVAGRAGYLLNQKINTIFALDPAEPGFKNLVPEHRIDSSDAKYVEVIHTDAGFLGLTDPVGHADFYPNYGQGQLGCIRYFSGCSHERAYQYFAESINSTVGFWAKRCADMNEIRNGKCSFIGDFVQMAQEPSAPKKGLYYLPTKLSPPFAMGK